MVQYTAEEIIARYTYTSAFVDGNIVQPITKEYIFNTQKRTLKTGIMLVGWGGNNGSTLTAGIIANREHITWNTKDGQKSPNYYGSITQSSTVKIGSDAEGCSVYTPLKNIVPMVNPNELVIGGWDISSVNLADAMIRSRVIDYDLQQKLIPYMKNMKPLPSIYYEDFIAANQCDRADNILVGSKQEHLDIIRGNIRDFKRKNNLEQV